MPQIRYLADNSLITTAVDPAWVNGIWECGDKRFVDLEQNLYSPVSNYQTMTPMQFYIAFKSQERIAIKTSTDPNVVEFWATFNIAKDASGGIDPNLVSVQEALEYLALPVTSGGAGILASTDRISQICAGTPQ